jgi:hypothetical protein
MLYYMRHLTDILVLGSIGLLTTTIGFAIAWVRATNRALRAESYLEGIRSVHAPANANITPAIDAIAMEVERIGEGQRFLTKVISEQRSPLLPPRAAGSITPH